MSVTLTWIQIAQTVERLMEQGSRAERSAAYLKAAAMFQVAATTAKRATNAYRFASDMAKSSSIPLVDISCTMTAAEEMRSLKRFDADHAMYLSARFLLGKINVAEIRRLNEHYRDIQLLEKSNEARVTYSAKPWAAALALAKSSQIAIDGTPFENELTMIIGCDVGTMDEYGKPWFSLHLSPRIPIARFADQKTEELGRSALAATTVFRTVIVITINRQESIFFERFLVLKAKSKNIVIIQNKIV